MDKADPTLGGIFKQVVSASNRDMAFYNNPTVEAAKEVPKKKTVHAKVKINEGKVITVVNPDVIKHGDEMETDEDEQVVDGLGNEMSCNGGSSSKKHSVKIIPRKVGVKKM